MNLHHEGRILYISMADVSQPNGPGVNEREFMVSLFGKFGSRAHALIPAPKRPCADVVPSQATLFPNSPKWDPIGFIRQQWKLKRGIERLLAGEQFDLIVVRLGVLPLGFCLARLSVPYALKTLGSLDLLRTRAGWKGVLGRLLAPLNESLFRRIARGALAADTCTELLYQYHVEQFGFSPERLLLQGNAVNVKRFFPQDQNHARAKLRLGGFDPILGYVGGHPDERGGLEMVEIASRLVADYPRLGVVVVGGPGEERVRRRASELGLDAHVVIPGQVPYEKIPTYVNCFDVCYALDRPERFRLWGNSYQKVRQYVACGKPILTCVPAGSFLLAEGLAASVRADDLDSIEAATRRLLAWDEKTRRAHAARAAAYAREHLSAEAALNRRIDFWNQRLEHDGPSRRRKANLYAVLR